MERLYEFVNACRRCTEPGGPEALKIVERAIPVPGEGELLVKVHAAAINRPDVMQRQGLYPPPPVHPIFSVLKSLA